MKKIITIITLCLAAGLHASASSLMTDVGAGTSFAEISLGMHRTNLIAIVTDTFDTRVFPNQAKTNQSEEVTLCVTNSQGFRVVTFFFKRDVLAAVSMWKHDKTNVFFEQVRNKSKAKLGELVEESKKIFSHTSPEIESVSVLTKKTGKEGVSLYKSGTLTVLVLFDPDKCKENFGFISPATEKRLEEARQERLQPERQNSLPDEN